MRQAITTKYIGPTNTKPGRIAVSCDAKRIVVSWDHSKNVDDNHIAAALKLALRPWLDRRVAWWRDERRGFLLCLAGRAAR